jgi:hypothetical protein
LKKEEEEAEAEAEAEAEEGGDWAMVKMRSKGLNELHVRGLQSDEENREL